MFDSNGDGQISMAEFLDAMTRFSNQDAGDKIAFLFKLYDQDGDGGLSEGEIETVIRSYCIVNVLKYVIV